MLVMCLDGSNSSSVPLCERRYTSQDNNEAGCVGIRAVPPLPYCIGNITYWQPVTSPQPHASRNVGIRISSEQWKLSAQIEVETYEFRRLTVLTVLRHAERKCAVFPHELGALCATACSSQFSTHLAFRLSALCATACSSQFSTHLAFRQAQLHGFFRPACVLSLYSS